MDSRKEIPQRTWYNGQFLFQFDEQLKVNPNQTISQFTTNFLISQEIQNHNFYHTKNQGTVILLMYGLLVIPREIWENSATNFQFTTRDKFKVITTPNNGDPDTLNFLRLLRNSLAHANFAIDSQAARFKFWNSQRNETKNFEVEINYADLGEFLSEVGKYYVNALKNKA